MLFAPAQQPALTFQVGHDGLSIELAGVPIVRGSTIQYYEPGWTKAYYSSSNGGAQKISRPDPQTVTVSFTDGPAHGAVTYHQEGNSLKAHYDLEWDGDHPIDIELGAGLIWAPALDRGSLTADGQPTHRLDRTYYSSGSVDVRKFAFDSKVYKFTAPLGSVSATSTLPITLFDARNGYPQDWAQGRSLWWYGDLALPVEKGKPAVMDIQWDLAPAQVAGSAPAPVKLASTPNPSSLMPNTDRPRLIPNPKVNQLDWDHPVDITGGFTFPVGLFDHYQEFVDTLARRFQVPKPDPSVPKQPFVGGYSKMGMVPGGYLITVDSKGVNVLGEQDEGVETGMIKLASLVFLKNGHLYLPSGQLDDQPKTEWRGVHLFVGPHALEFQKRLWTNVLRPLGFNKVVLQCERTKWDSVPGVESDITMSKAQLVKLFDMYRAMGIEPIPLVESYGHMEWFFNNGKNLGLAMNPAQPYAVDPRKPGTAAILEKLWAEIISTLNPHTVHFGLDEVDMVGVPKDPALQTQLWKTQLALLDHIAAENRVRMMLWGDECLAPGEAPDATNGDTPQDAAARRDAITKGALIGDWHYIADPDPHRYTKTEQLWKDEGVQPIATTWYQPDNIRGFYEDAAELKVGTLQTTWAGYESSEENMLQSYDQFSAMILAAEYGWSGSEEEESKLGYDPADVFRDMYFANPSALTPLPGTSLGVDPGFQIGRVRFGSSCDVTVGSRILGQSVSTDHPVEISAKGKGTELAIAMRTVAPGERGEQVAELTVTLANGATVTKKLEYGIEVKAVSDPGGLPLASRDASGRCCYLLDLGSAPVGITSIAIKPLNTYTGLQISGLELIG